MSHPSILVINAGSSSIKFTLFEKTAKGDLPLIGKGAIEGINADVCTFVGKDAKGTVLLEQSWNEKRDHAASLSFLLPWIEKTFEGYEMVAAGHRVVHGGTQYAEPVKITPQVIEYLEGLIPWLPCTSRTIWPPSRRWRRCIRACRRSRALIPPSTIRICLWPTVSACRAPCMTKACIAMGSMACLMSSSRAACPPFRRVWLKARWWWRIWATAPACAPWIRAQHRQHHGLYRRRGSDDGHAHRFAGSWRGAVSVAEQENGRQGHRDFAVQAKRPLGVSGISSDMRTLLESKDPRAAEAIDLFTFFINRHMGALMAVLGGLDGLAFTAGIGERGTFIRAKVASLIAPWTGLKLDVAANEEARAAASPRASRLPTAVWNAG